MSPILPMSAPLLMIIVTVALVMASERNLSSQMSKFLCHEPSEVGSVLEPFLRAAHLTCVPTSRFAQLVSRVEALIPKGVGLLLNSLFLQLLANTRFFQFFALAEAEGRS